MRIVTSKQMKQIEQNSIQYQMSYLRLMENAGCAAPQTPTHCTASAARHAKGTSRA